MDRDQSDDGDSNVGGVGGGKPEKLLHVNNLIKLKSPGALLNVRVAGPPGDNNGGQRSRLSQDKQCV
jgi:hypothetical protein